MLRRLRASAGFKFFGERSERFDVAFELGENIFALAGEFEVGVDIAGAADEFLVPGDELFEALAVAHERLRRGRVARGLPG